MGKKIRSPQQVLVYFKTTKKQQTILDKKMRERKKQWRCLGLKKEKKEVKIISLNIKPKEKNLIPIVWF